jgi:hypothetical protein
MPLGSGASGVFISVRDYSGFSAMQLKGFVMFEGVFERGPIGSVTLCSDLTDLRRNYGWLIDGYESVYLAKRAMSYGAQLIVNRVAHYTDPADRTTLTATKGVGTLVDRAGSPGDTLGIAAINEGAWSGGLRWTVTDGTINPTTEFNITFSHDTDDFIISETYENASMDPAEANYILTLVNGPSKIVTVSDEGDGTDYAERRPATGTGLLAEGDDGLAGLNGADYVGDDAANTGLYTLDSVDYSKLLVVADAEKLEDPGLSTVHSGMKTYCKTHRLETVFGILVTPMGLDPQDAADYRNGVDPVYTPINDWTVGMFWGDLGVVNPRTGNSIVYVSPAGDVAGAMARGHKDRNEHIAVAGPRYALLNDVHDIRYNVGPIGKRGQADILAMSQVNPLVFTDEGAYIDGIATLQRNATQLSNITTAMTIMVMKTALWKYGRSYCYMKIGPVVWKLMAAEIEPWLASLVEAQGLYDYYWNSDQNAPDIYSGTINKRETIERGLLLGDAAIKATVDAKWVGFTITLAKLFAQFQDFEKFSVI